MRNRRPNNLDGKIDTCISWLVRRRDKVCQMCGENNPNKLESHHIIFKSHGDAGRLDPKHSILLCTNHHHHKPDAPHKNNKKFWVWLEDYLIKRGEKNRLKELNAIKHSPPIQIRLADKKALLKDLQEEIKHQKDNNWQDEVGIDEIYKGRDEKGNPIFA